MIGVEMLRFKGNFFGDQKTDRISTSWGIIVIILQFKDKLETNAGLD
jgi:hypothetical protein